MWRIEASRTLPCIIKQNVITIYHKKYRFIKSIHIKISIIFIVQSKLSILLVCTVGIDQLVPVLLEGPLWFEQYHRQESSRCCQLSHGGVALDPYATTGTIDELTSSPVRYGNVVTRLRHTSCDGVIGYLFQVLVQTQVSGNHSKSVTFYC